ncbi:MAG: YdcF family protein [Cyanobacteria bacterium J06634_6]
MLQRIWRAGKLTAQVIAISATITGIVLSGTIWMKLYLAAQQSPIPEAILVLGGCSKREKEAARIAAVYPEMEVWVSTGEETPEETYTVFEAAGVIRDRVHLDYRATDTVTNFTALVAEFQYRNIHHVYIVTSDFHMPRAKVIATIVLGHSAITFTPVPTITDRQHESWGRIARDGGRSLLWIFTGNTGEQIGRSLREASAQ